MNDSKVCFLSCSGQQTEVSEDGGLGGKRATQSGPREQWMGHVDGSYRQDTL